MRPKKNSPRDHTVNILYSVGEGVIVPVTAPKMEPIHPTATTNQATTIWQRQKKKTSEQRCEQRGDSRFYTIGTEPAE